MFHKKLLHPSSEWLNYFWCMFKWCGGNMCWLYTWSLPVLATYFLTPHYFVYRDQFGHPEDGGRAFLRNVAQCNQQSCVNPKDPYIGKYRHENFHLTEYNMMRSLRWTKAFCDPSVTRASNWDFTIHFCNFTKHYSNFPIIQDGQNSLFTWFLYWNHQVHRDFLITLYMPRFFCKTRTTFCIICLKNKYVFYTNSKIRFCKIFHSVRKVNSLLLAIILFYSL